MVDFSKRLRVGAIAALFTVLALAGCGGKNDSDNAGSPSAPASTKASVGAEGGTVTGPDGVQVVVPPGALDKPTDIGIARTNIASRADVPELVGLKAITEIYEVTPHGTAFASSARIHIPFNPDSVPVGARAVLIRAQPGGTWEMLDAQSEGTNPRGVTNALGADTPSLSFYTVGTCYTTADANVPGPDPLIACPAAHSLTLTLQDGSGANIPVPNRANGYSPPVMTITTPTRVGVRLDYTRPPSGRLDYVSLSAFGAPRPADWPLSRPFGNDSAFIAGLQLNQTIDIDPAAAAFAGRSTIVRFRAAVTTTLDAFYPGCVCFKPASWNYEAEISILVVGTPVPVVPVVPVVTHIVGGTVNGLTGAGLVLQNNGGNNLAVSANATAFSFASAIAAGAPYSVTVLTQPTGQTCTVTNGSGTANTAVSNLSLLCATPVPPLVAGVVLSARAGHTCALKSDSSVACWGLNTSYQLGDGTGISKNKPVDVAGLTGVVAVAASTFHSCAIKSDTSVVCWGANAEGQLGDGSGLTQPSPVAVTGLTGVTALSGGRDHTCAIVSEGTVVCWGNNTFGQLGNGTTTASSSPVVALTAGAVALSAGWDFTCAVMASSSVRCWGRNDLSQLGIGTTAHESVPRAVSGLTGAVGIGTGNFHACAVKADGSVACWGDNSEGQLGDGTLVKKTMPVVVSGLSGVVAISTGSAHNCALKADGTVSCWGANSRGQIGDGTAGTANNKTAPVAVTGLSGVSALAAGSAYNCALKTDGSAVCWGWNIDGSIGDGTNVDRPTPAAVFGGPVFWR